MSEDKSDFITVYNPIAGWKAVHYTWNDEGFWEPYQTGYLAFVNKEDAIKNAKAWAEAEGVRYVD